MYCKYGLKGCKFQIIFKGNSHYVGYVVKFIYLFFFIKNIELIFSVKACKLKFMIYEFLSCSDIIIIFKLI